MSFEPEQNNSDQLDSRNENDEGETLHYSFELNSQTDKDIIDWLENQESLNEAIPDAIRSKLRKRRKKKEPEGKNLTSRNIMYLRRIYDITQEELGNRFGYADSTIDSYEKGTRPLPNELLKKIADYFMVHEENIKNFDLSELEPFKFDVFFKYIDELFPVQTNFGEGAPGSQYISEYHKSLISQIKKCTQNLEDLLKRNINIAFEFCQKAYWIEFEINNKFRKDIAVNYWSLVILYP